MRSVLSAFPSTREASARESQPDGGSNSGGVMRFLVGRFLKNPRNLTYFFVILLTQARKYVTMRV
jgi:hypothetical protein